MAKHAKLIGARVDADLPVGVTIDALKARAYNVSREMVHKAAEIARDTVAIPSALVELIAAQRSARQVSLRLDGLFKGGRVSTWSGEVNIPLWMLEHYGDIFTNQKRVFSDMPFGRTGISTNLTLVVTVTLRMEVDSAHWVHLACEENMPIKTANVSTAAFKTLYNDGCVGQVRATDIRASTHPFSGAATITRW